MLFSEIQLNSQAANNNFLIWIVIWLRKRNIWFFVRLFLLDKWYFLRLFLWNKWFLLAELK